MLTFQQGTKIVIDDGSDKYELLIGSGTATQTFVEAIQNVKTIHNPYLVERAFSTEKSVVNLSFDCHIAKDDIILSWFGINGIIDFLNTSIEFYDVYIVAAGTTYKLANCIGQNISFKISRKDVLTASITAVAPDIVIVPNDTIVAIPQQPFYNSTVIIDNFPRLESVSCEVTRSITWAGKKSLFDIGSIYTAKNAILESMAISGSITQNKVDDSDTSTSEFTPVRITYGDSFEINLAACNTTSRWDMASIHKKITEYKVQPYAVNSFIKF